ncbi:MAG TPA: redox-regulated ATPase YchF [Patescibacteria group bacterium]|nr:redox-regulated ATPase YchF [Patescibacteria group bacterium]
MSLSVGIVGLPNVGKSTLFNALLKQQVALAANYPFATIEPNVGIAQVPDDRLPKLAEVVHTSVIKPATVEFVDIAGLVKGASTGEGLGNQFLSHIREVDAMCFVLRDFSDPDIIRRDSTDPKSDLEILRLELQLADEQTLAKHEKSKNQDKENLPLFAKKPFFVAINVDEGELVRSAQYAGKYAEELGIKVEQIVIVSAKIESELSSLSEEDQKEYMKDIGIEKSGLQRLAETAYKTLHLQSFLTAGEMEVRAWTIPDSATAVEASGVIHTDFMKKFIKANVASYDDFIALGGWKGVREAGKMRIEGRDYLMRDGDVVEFMIGN